MTIPEAIEVFVKGHAYTRSATHPCEAVKLDGMWLMRDPPGAKYERKKEIVAYGLTPEETARRIREAGVGWHFVCHIHEPEAPYQELRARYKEQGYRALATEWMFVHDLADIPMPTSSPLPSRVRSAEEAEFVRQAAGRKQILHTELSAEPAPLRLYAIIDGTEAKGWVRSVPVGKNAWVSNLYVRENDRGKGYGFSLMAAMLRDDKAQGILNSVLLASSDGARLYPHLGYRMVGVLQMFCPTQRSGR